MQNSCQPLYLDGGNITGRAQTDVVGKRFLRVVANAVDGVPPVGHAPAAGRIFGVSGYNALAGATLPVIRKGVVPVTAGAAITFDQEVEVDATGKAVPKAAGVAVGVALFSAASGADCFVVLYE